MSNAKTAQMIQAAIKSAAQQIAQAHAHVMHNFNVAFSSRMAVLEERIAKLEQAVAPAAQPREPGSDTPATDAQSQKETAG
jgi:hypothetical protein